MSSSNCCFLTCISVFQEAGQVVWYSHLFQNFPQFIVIHTVKWCEPFFKVFIKLVTILFLFYGLMFWAWDIWDLNFPVQFSHSVVSDSLQPHKPQHARPPCPSPTPGVYSNSCPLSRWCHPTISSSVIPFSSCLQSFPTSGSFQMNQLFASGKQGSNPHPCTRRQSLNHWTIRDVFIFLICKINMRNLGNGSDMWV